MPSLIFLMVIEHPEHTPMLPSKNGHGGGADRRIRPLKIVKFYFGEGIDFSVHYFSPL
jgi:hypothetical protein